MSAPVASGWFRAALAQVVVGAWPLLAQDGPPKPGEPAPAFALERLEGGRVGLIDLRGRPVIVNFWATWCIPCRTEMPELALAWKQHRAAGLEVLAVNLTDQERRKDVHRFAEDLGIPFPVLLDVRDRVRERYELVMLPTTVFVDTDRQRRVALRAQDDSAGVCRGSAT